MKTLSSVILFSLSIGLLNPAAAESFNEHGEDWVNTLIPSREAVAHSENYPITRTLGFKERGEDWVVKVSPSASMPKPSQCPVDDLLATHTLGFNNKYNFRC